MADGAQIPAVVVIDAARPTSAFDPRELWAFRDLLYFLARRDIAVRYRQTVLGVLWAVIQPVMHMVVFTVFLGHLAGVPSDGMPYPVFSLLGLLPWMYFSGAITRAGASLVGSAALITRVYFPRVLVPLAAMLSALVDFAIALSVLAGLLLWYGMVPSPSAALLLPLVAITLVAAAGPGLALAALNVRYRDVQHAVPFFMQVWMFATPVVYPTSLVPDGWRWLYAFNPMTGVIEAYRGAVFGHGVDWAALGLSSASAVAMVLAGARMFQRTERTFADVV
jgi:lipopolysaccharide transport system permease protein